MRTVISLMVCLIGIVVVGGLLTVGGLGMVWLVQHYASLTLPTFGHVHPERVIIGIGIVIVGLDKLSEAE